MRRSLGIEKRILRWTGKGRVERKGMIVPGHYEIDVFVYYK